MRAPPAPAACALPAATAPPRGRRAARGGPRGARRRRRPRRAGRAGSGRLRIAGVGRRAQEDARSLVWNGSGGASVQILAAQPRDISRESNGELSLVFEYRVDAAPTAPVTLSMGQTGFPVTGALRAGGVGRGAEAGAA